MTDFISKESVFANSTKLAEILIESDGYTDFHEKIVSNNIEYNEQKTYEVVPSGFIDFNQHLYENINDMNSISTGIYLEMSLITYRIFIWSSKGEGFEIFKHVLRGEEISKLNRIEDFKEYLYNHIHELEQGIVKTYGADAKKAFEDFGMGIESRKLPLPSILQYMTIENNIQDFR
ncbi:hypothetical protein CHL78_007945 [Romboutsia weinsteinii]|uniref:Uncharacterized protein n=1 Tax=Romboutsia weinsteinii TaxID=2020949 RepID=A0A371J5I0_9FIRM|nr:hypothetical protein [Romboutsia weinsteinii]RDY27926.1 hypothetical protein CHL78_007945 [Romboutsia weinsteinii]